MKNAKLSLIFSVLLVFILSILLVSSVQTNLITPSDNSVDTDGYLDLRGSCVPTANTTVSFYNITNATVYSNVDGTWKANATLQPLTGSSANSTFLFNFTNHINQSAEGEFQWNILCVEKNISGGLQVNSAFAGNKTIKVKYARPIVTTTAPVNNHYSLNGHFINVTGTALASTGWNISSIDLLTTIRSDPNVGGGAGENYTVNQTLTVGNLATEFNFHFIINNFGNASISDGADITWSFRANQFENLSPTGNEPLILSDSASANRSFNVEYPPQIPNASVRPLDLNWSQGLRTRLNWTVVSAFTTSKFETRIWTNESGEFLPRTGAIIINNNSGTFLDYLFDEKSDILWGIQASQQDNPAVFNFSINRTIRIDATNPTLSINTDSFQRATVTVVYTPVDANIDATQVFSNISGSFAEDYTNASTELKSGEVITLTFTDIVDGVYVFNVTVNDSSKRNILSGDNSLIVDTAPPIVTNLGNISAGVCDARRLNWTTNEAANFTVFIDTDSENTNGDILTNSTKLAGGHSTVFNYDFDSEIRHFINITACDAAGNCNSSGQSTFDTPANVCAGWSQYSVYDAAISLDTLQNQSGADLVYFWNATNQDWVFLAAGLSTNANVEIGWRTPYHVVHLFENTFSTWFRNTTNNGIYSYNVTVGSNWISIPEDYTFGNLTESFMNGTVQFPSQIGNGSAATTVVFNITNFAGYNNTLQDYVSHIFNFTQVNTTLLEPCPNRVTSDTCLEAVWVGSAFNLTWNGTGIDANWTI